MGSKSWPIAAFGSLLILSGCITSKVVRPDSISLSEALVDVVRSLNAMAEVESSLKNGLVPAEVVVTFDVTAADQSGTDAAIDVVPTGVVTEIPRVGGAWHTEVRGSKGNQITVKFRSILFATERELLLRKSPEEIDQIFEKLKKLGWNVKLK